MRFRKKPVEVEAVQWNGPEDDHAISQFLGSWSWSRNSAGEPCIKTLESGDGQHTVSAGDWIIKGVQGEFYACKPDIFDETYEPIE
jgi:hypothetical protein